jgi:hypothetical protein
MRNALLNQDVEVVAVNELRIVSVLSHLPDFHFSLFRFV